MGLNCWLQLERPWGLPGPVLRGCCRDQPHVCPSWDPEASGVSHPVSGEVNALRQTGRAGPRQAEKGAGGGGVSVQQCTFPTRGPHRVSLLRWLYRDSRVTHMSRGLGASLLVYQ